MKKENLEEAKILVNRIEKFENAIEVCDTKGDLPLKFFLKPFKQNKLGFIDVCHDDSYINLSDEQSQELLNIIKKKWLKEDKEKLGAL